MQKPQETRVWSLSQENLPEEEMATHSSILAWRIQWTENPGGLQAMGPKESDPTKHIYQEWRQFLSTAYTLTNLTFFFPPKCLQQMQRKKRILIALSANMGTS